MYTQKLLKCLTYKYTRIHQNTSKLIIVKLAIKNSKQVTLIAIKYYMYILILIYDTWLLCMYPLIDVHVIFIFCINEIYNQ